MIQIALSPSKISASTSVGSASFASYSQNHPPTPSIGRDTVLRFETFLTEEGLAGETVRSYVSDVQQLARWLSGKRLRAHEIGDKELSLFIQDLLGRVLELRPGQVGRYSPMTVRRKLTSLRRFYHFLEAEAHIDRNPVTKDMLSSSMFRKPTPDTKVLSLEMVRQLLAAPHVRTPKGTRDRALMALMLFCGLEVGEVNRLNVCDLDLQRMTLEVTGRRGNRRSVPVPDAICKPLHAWMATRKLTGTRSKALFISLHWSSSNGRPGRCLSKRGVRKVIDRYLEEIGEKRPGMSARSLRKTFAVLGLEAGATLSDVSFMMGVNVRTAVAYERIAKATMVSDRKGAAS